MLLTFIISQRKSISAIASSVELLANSFGTHIVTEREKIYAFPTLVQLSHATTDDLINLKLGYRVPYVQDAITKVRDGNWI